MKQKIEQYKISFMATLIMALPVISGAEGLVNPLKQKSIGELIRILVQDILVGIIAPIAVTLALVYTGFMFVTAQGKPAELEIAKRNFLFVLAGAVLLLGASVLLGVVTNTVNQL